MKTMPININVTRVLSCRKLKTSKYWKDNWMSFIWSFPFFSCLPCLINIYFRVGCSNSVCNPVQRAQKKIKLKANTHQSLFKFSLSWWWFLLEILKRLLTRRTFTIYFPYMINESRKQGESGTYWFLTQLNVLISWFFPWVLVRASYNNNIFVCVCVCCFSFLS